MNIGAFTFVVNIILFVINLITGGKIDYLMLINALTNAASIVWAVEIIRDTVHGIVIRRAHKNGMVMQAEEY